MMKQCATFLSHLVLLVLLAASTARAQGAGEITGTIVDDTGGVMPGVTNTATGAVRNSVTNESNVHRHVRVHARHATDTEGTRSLY